MRWSWFRIAAAVIALSGIVAGFIVNIDRASRESQDLELVLVNYFSMFTIVSALLSVIALVAAATWAQRHPGTTREPLGIALGLAAVAGPLLLLGIVYNVLLRDAPSGIALGDTAGIGCWTRTRSRCCTSCCRSTSSSICCWLRDVADCRGGRSPSFVATPWDGPPTRWCGACGSRTPMAATAWWYPYPFLDPHNAGYGSAFTYIGVMLVGFLAIGAIIIAIGRYREKRAAVRGGAAPAAGALHA